MAATCRCVWRIQQQQQVLRPVRRDMAWLRGPPSSSSSGRLRRTPVRSARPTEYQEDHGAATITDAQATALVPLPPLDIAVAPDSVLSEQDPAYVLLARRNLAVTRQIEMMNVLLGYDQANQYAIKDETGASVGYIGEEDTFGKSIARQLLHTHRKFNASVFDLEGKLLLSVGALMRIHRPFSLINSKIYIARADGQQIGEVHQEWHLWRRRYNLFDKDQTQFARIDSGFLSWDFALQDEQGQSRALIDRNFMGFGREIFTDTGHYAVHFSGSGESLTLDERAVALAAAITIDVDYFSRTRSGLMGGGFPLMLGGGGGGESRTGGDTVPTVPGTDGVPGSGGGMTPPIPIIIPGIGGIAGSGASTPTTAPPPPGPITDAFPPASTPFIPDDASGAVGGGAGASKWGDEGWDIPDSQSGVDTDDGGIGDGGGDGGGAWSWVRDLVDNLGDNDS
ncbi:hypothetical protein RI367_004325 [Sorochytrium milnesiophthora]